MVESELVAPCLPRRDHRLIARTLVDLELGIWGHQLTKHHRASKQVHGRQVASAISTAPGSLTARRRGSGDKIDSEAQLVAVLSAAFSSVSSIRHCRIEVDVEHAGAVPAQSFGAIGSRIGVGEELVARLLVRSAQRGNPDAH